MDIFPTATSKLAHVALPAGSFAESDGTFTNSERRMQRVRQALLPMPGKANWETIQELFTRMDYPMKYQSAEEIFVEMADLTPSYGGMSYERLNEKGLCWPYPNPEHPGTQYLHKDQFTRAGGGIYNHAFYGKCRQSMDLLGAGSVNQDAGIQSVCG